MVEAQPSPAIRATLVAAADTAGSAELAGLFAVRDLAWPRPVADASVEAIGAAAG